MADPPPCASSRQKRFQAFRHDIVQAAPTYPFLPLGPLGQVMSTTPYSPGAFVANWARLAAKSHGWPPADLVSRQPKARDAGIIVRPPLLHPPHIYLITGGVPGPESRKILPVLGGFSQAGNDFMIHPPSPPQISRQDNAKSAWHARDASFGSWSLQRAACSVQRGDHLFEIAPGGNALDRCGADGTILPST